MDDPPLNRRAFFRSGLRELFKPLARAAGPIEEAIRQLGELGDVPPPAAKPPSSPPAEMDRGLANGWVRPPGALPEDLFKDACSRCGECVRVCPVKCIRIDSSGLLGGGVPFIDVQTNPCVLCAGLQCMHHCPSGALVPTPIGDIDMGTAVWLPLDCVRPLGDSCQVCVDQCPIGEVAIVTSGSAIEVKPDGCTGCGVCQNKCPTTPKSIVVRPTIRPSAPAPRSRPKN